MKRASGVALPCDFRLSTPSPPGRKAPPENPAARHGPGRLLLVEDNEINRVVAREMLEAAGHVVQEAHNGREAVERAQVERFDLIFMDISMPVMDGREATRAIRSGDGPCAQVPIIALTANAVAEEQETFLSDGMDDIVTKPLSRAALGRVLTEHLGDVSRKQEHAPESPVLAEHYLDELRETIGIEALQGLLDRFNLEMEALVTYLASPAGQDLAETASRAHKIAGSAATLGAVALRAALVRIENTAKARDSEGMDRDIIMLSKVWSQTRDVLVADRRMSPRPAAH